MTFFIKKIVRILSEKILNFEHFYIFKTNSALSDKIILNKDKMFRKIQNPYFWCKKILEFIQIFSDKIQKKIFMRDDNLLRSKMF